MSTPADILLRVRIATHMIEAARKQAVAVYDEDLRGLRELDAKAGRDAVVILLCRSGKRSAAAGEAAAAAGFNNVFNVLEGFEGDLDTQQQRGESGGWSCRRP